MKRLPATVEDLAGARAARWIRESTPGQFDRYGPEAQTEFQDRAITRLGLVDSGLAWRAAHSGRTVYRSPRWRHARGRRRRGVRRPARRLRLALAAQPAPDARAARGHSPPRRGPRVLLRRGDPLLVRAPLGPARRRGQGRRALQPPPVAPDPRGLRQQAGQGARPGRPPAVRLPAQRRRSCSSPTRSACRSSRGSSSSPRPACPTAPSRRASSCRSSPSGASSPRPLYAGRLRDGEPAHWPPLVAAALWEASRRTAQGGRPTPAGRRTRAGRTRSTCSTARRCGRRLTGDTGYYRHREPCQPFVAARPEHRGRGQLGPRPRLPPRTLRADRESSSPRCRWVPRRSRAWSARLRRAAGARPPGAATGSPASASAPWPATCAIGMPRPWSGRWLASIAQEAAAATARQAAEAIPADVAVRYVRELPETWRKAEGGSGRPAARERAVRAASRSWGSGRRRSTSARMRCDTGLRRRSGEMRFTRKWSGREDLNLRPHRPERCALPSCATPRP